MFFFFYKPPFSGPQFFFWSLPTAPQFLPTSSFSTPLDIFSKGPISSFTKFFPQKLAFSNLGQTGRNRADRDLNNSMFFFHSVNTELTFADSWGPIKQEKN